MSTSEGAPLEQVTPEETPAKRQRRTSEQAATVRQMTLSEASVEFGVARATLMRKLVRAEVEIGDGITYTIGQVHRALVGSLEAERIRQISADADLKELERLEKLRILIPRAEISEILRAVLLPIRQRFLALPGEMAAKVNPSEPLLAQRELDRWAGAAMPLLRESMPT
jgi:hypothetical protein